MCVKSLNDLCFQKLTARDAAVFVTKSRDATMAPAVLNLAPALTTRVTLGLSFLAGTIGK